MRQWMEAADGGGYVLIEFWFILIGKRLLRWVGKSLLANGNSSLMSELRQR